MNSALTDVTLQATVVGNRVFLFGGEDHQRQQRSNTAMLHLKDMTWEVLELDEDDAQPAPRSAHTATCIKGRWVVIFGGGSAAHCFNDVWAFDTQKLRWQQLHVAGGSPTPRAGAPSGVSRKPQCPACCSATSRAMTALSTLQLHVDHEHHVLLPAAAEQACLVCLEKLAQETARPAQTC